MGSALRTQSYNYVLFWFEAFDVIAGVFGTGLFQVHIAYVRQRAEPGEDIGKFLLFIFCLIGCQGGGKFSDLFDKPHKRGGDASLPVSLFVFFGNETLKFADIHLVSSQFVGAQGISFLVLLYSTFYPLLVRQGSKNISVLKMGKSS